MNKDAAGTLKLGQARGIALLAPAQAGLAVAEYAPNAVKKTVVGVGHADKAQVQHMVRLQLPGVVLAGPDAADALAVALCHAHHAALRRAAGGGAGEGGGGRGMIGKVSGRLDYRAGDHVLIDTGGVGYLVYCSDRTLAAMPGPGGAVALYTDLLVREDLMQLFGFPTLAEREWHRLLMSVQGVGAKAALAILGALGTEGLARALAIGRRDGVPRGAGRGAEDRAAGGAGAEVEGARGDRDGGAGRTRRGRRGAGGARRDRAGGGSDACARRGGAEASAEALSALVNLGYGPGEAAAAVSEAGLEPGLGTAALIRAALKRLAPKV